MAKEKKNNAAQKSENASFEEKLERLQILSDEIKNPGTGLEEALSIFEEGIALAKSIEKELSRIENRIQVLINNPKEPDEIPELDLFSSAPEE